VEDEMKVQSKWSLLLLALLVFGGHREGSSAPAKKAKPKAAKVEAQWELVGTISPEDYSDPDDYEELSELGDIFLRTYQTYKVDGKDELVLVSKKKIQIVDDESFTVNGKKHLVAYGQEQLGRVEILKKPHGKKVEPFEKSLEKIKPEGKTFELYAEADPNAPARCWDSGARVLFPPYPVRTWGQCVAWAQSTRQCRQVEMPEHYPPVSTDGCKCFY